MLTSVLAYVAKAGTTTQLGHDGVYSGPVPFSSRALAHLDARRGVLDPNSAGMYEKVIIPFHA